MLGCLAILLMRELIVCECTGLPFLLGDGNKNVVFNDWAYAYNEAPTDKWSGQYLLFPPLPFRTWILYDLVTIPPAP